MERFLNAFRCDSGVRCHEAQVRSLIKLSSTSFAFVHFLASAAMSLTTQPCMPVVNSSLPADGHPSCMPVPNSLCADVCPGISINWYEMTFEGFDSYVDWLDFDHHFHDWLQSSVQQNYTPPIAKKASHIQRSHMIFDVSGCHDLNPQ